MKFIKFNFTKISASKSENFTPDVSLNNSIDILKIEKEDIPNENNFKAIKVFFTFSVGYNKIEPKEKEDSNKANQIGEVLLEGKIVFASPNEEAENLISSWNKKEIPLSVKVPLFNLILKKCASKALELEDTLNLPPHIPLPSIKIQDEKGNK